MSGGVDKVENVFFTVGSRVIYADGTSLDRDSALTLKVHVVKELFFHVPFRHTVGKFKDTVGKGGLAVVYVSDNRKISYMLLLFVSLCHVYLHSQSDLPTKIYNHSAYIISIFLVQINSKGEIFAREDRLNFYKRKKFPNRNKLYNIHIAFLQKCGILNIGHMCPGYQISFRP